MLKNGTFALMEDVQSLDSCEFEDQSDSDLESEAEITSFEGNSG